MRNGAAAWGGTGCTALLVWDWGPDEGEVSEALRSGKQGEVTKGTDGRSSKWAGASHKGLLPQADGEGGSVATGAT